MTFPIPKTAAAFILLTMLAVPLEGAAPPHKAHVTTDELDGLLGAWRHENDKSAARDLAGIGLIERADAAHVSRWMAELPGIRSRDALLALADAAAFLPLPAAEIAAGPAPDEATRAEILKRTMEYVERMQPKLPDFLAQRSTTSFVIGSEEQMKAQDSMARLYGAERRKEPSYYALGPAKASGLAAGLLYWNGSFSQVVTYRGGLEVVESSAGGGAPTGMTTTGEFGPILSVIAEQASSDKIAWDHWEQGATGRLAVFRYSVPHEQSHFAVEFSADHLPEFPAFHGEFAVDPESGSVHRITILASVREADSFRESLVLVEFGPTEIGGATYVVPVHGVAIAKTFSPLIDLDRPSGPDAQPPPIPFETSINDVAFTNYHVFQSKSRIVTGKEAQ
jgi:hypothetical protein